jgi:acetamidase/formamidase
MSAEELARHKTDGHMDVAAVRAGATIVCPVKVPGGGVYLGDMHALQGDGEIAGHTCDVAGHATLQVDVLKGLSIDGPILFPVDEDLPFLARAMPRRERNSAIEIAKSHDVKELERNLPISFIGTGKDLNLAIDNGLQRAADLLQMSVPDVKNRATILGGIEIGRSPGVARVTFRAPTAALERVGLRALAEEIYGKAQI